MQYNNAQIKFCVFFLYSNQIKALIVDRLIDASKKGWVSTRMSFKQECIEISSI